MSPDIARHGKVGLLCSLTHSLGWILAALPANAQAQVGTPGAAGQVGDPHATEGAAHVYLGNSAEPLVASADSPPWLDGASVVSIEWTYGASDPVSPVGAIGGGKRWPFHVDRARRWAVLKVTDEIREAWKAAGTLGISCEGNRLVELRCRPRRLLLGPDGEEFTLMQRASALVPGSRGWVEVLAGDILFGVGRLGVYMVEGETLARPRSVVVGDEVPFQIGEEAYRIEVGLLQGGLIGSHFAKLLVMKADGAEMPAQPMRARLIALVERELAKVDRRFDHAMRLLGEEKKAEARATLETSRRISEDLRRALRSIEKLAPRLEEAAPYLSIIKARIVRPPPPERPFDSPEPPEAKVLEVHKVGREYLPWTIRGRKRPFAKRSDLVPGQSVKLGFHATDPDLLVENPENGSVYWLVLATSVATRGSARLMGAPGRSDVVFAMPVREPRASGGAGGPAGTAFETCLCQGSRTGGRSWTFPRVPWRPPRSAMNLSTIPVPALLLLSLSARGAFGSQTAPARDPEPLSQQEARIQGRVVHDEDSAPVRHFRLHLRGERLEGTETDGWEYPRKKGGWICTRFARGRGEDDEAEEPSEEERLVAIRPWDRAPKEYRFDRGVRGGEGRFEWVVVADGCDLARGFVTLENGRAADLGEVRLRRGSAVIEGYVVDPLGRPVAEATVRLTMIPGLEPGILGRRNRRWTDKSGFYRFDRVPSGKGSVHVEPGHVAVMPSVPLTVEPASTKRVDFRPQVGTLRVTVEVAKGAKWTRPFKICLQSANGRTFVRWAVFPPHPEPGWVPGFSGLSSGIGCRRRPDSIELRAVRSPPAWEPRPPTVSGEGSPHDVAIDEGGSSFRIANVPVGEWRVSLRGVERDLPLAEREDDLGFSSGRERWEPPPLRPSPEAVEVRAGELTPLTLLTK